MKLIKPLLITLLILISVGLIAPSGLRAAIANNLWSIQFVRANYGQTSPAPPISDPPSTHQHAGLLLAIQALKADDPDLAATYLQTLSPSPDRLTRIILANVLFLEGNYAEAIDIWHDLGQWYSLEQASGALTVEKENADVRILALQAAYDLFPERYARLLISAMQTRADQLRAEGQLENAIPLYQQLIEQFPEQGPAYYGLADAYWQNGQPEQALDTIEAGGDLNAENKNFYLLAGKLYEQAGRTAQALQAYQKVLTIDPQNPEALEAIQRLSPTP